jgi:hypothetical protein
VAAAVILISAAVTWGQLTQSTSAQQANNSQPMSPAASVGLFAYPRNQQSSEKQLQDEASCYGTRVKKLLLALLL